MRVDWNTCQGWLLEVASADVRRYGMARPCLVTCSGDAPLFAAWLRPHPPGGYTQPLIELLALAGPLGADRLAFIASGRAWSLDDPIPPVTDGVDLRQPALVLLLADGHATTRAHVASSVHPYDVDGGGITWHEVFDPGDPGEGPLPNLLRASATVLRDMHGSPEQIREQALRCVALGHEVALAPAVEAHLGLDAA
jgi:hypothetical protein